MVGKAEVIYDSIVQVVNRKKDQQTETAPNSERVQTANRYRRAKDVRLERLNITRLGPGSTERTLNEQMSPSKSGQIELKQPVLGRQQYQRRKHPHEVKITRRQTLASLGQTQTIDSHRTNSSQS